MPSAWTDSLATGLRVIDAQHRQYFARVARLQSACLSAKAEEEVKKALEFVTEYVEFHFATEERLMDKYDYPEAAAHKRKHADFREELGRLRQRFLKTGSPELRLKLSGVLVDWLRSHIPTFDSRLVNFLKTCMTR